MPIYEYRCGKCRRKTSVLVRSPDASAQNVCEHCGSGDLTRLFSTFAVHRSSGGGADDLDGDAGMGGMDESDPRAMAHRLRQMNAEMGDDMGPEFNEMLDRLQGAFSSR